MIEYHSNRKWKRVDLGVPGSLLLGYSAPHATLTQLLRRQVPEAVPHYTTLPHMAVHGPERQVAASLQTQVFLSLMRNEQVGILGFSHDQLDEYIQVAKQAGTSCAVVCLSGQEDGAAQFLERGHSNLYSITIDPLDLLHQRIQFRTREPYQRVPEYAEEETKSLIDRMRLQITDERKMELVELFQITGHWREVLNTIPELEAVHEKARSWPLPRATRLTGGRCPGLLLFMLPTEPRSAHLAARLLMGEWSAFLSDPALEPSKLNQRALLQVNLNSDLPRDVIDHLCRTARSTHLQVVLADRQTDAAPSALTSHDMASVLENVATFVSFPDPSDSSCTDVQGGLSLVTTSGKARRLWQQPLTRSHFQVISGTVRLPFAPLMPEDRSWLWFRPARA